MPDPKSASPPPALTLPPQLVIEGAVDYPGSLIVQGTLDGDVTCKALTVAERAVITGAVRCDTAVVSGEVNGEIYANVLTLKADCTVVGDIYHNQLVLEDGCFFEGRSRRMIVPLVLA